MKICLLGYVNPGRKFQSQSLEEAKAFDNQDARNYWERNKNYILKHFYASI